MNQKTVYNIGHFLGRLPGWFMLILLILAFVGIAWILSLAGTHQIHSEMKQAVNDNGRIKAISDAAEAKRVLSDCQTTIENRRSEYNALMKSGKFWGASLALRTCADALADTELLQLVQDAEIKSHLSDLKDPAKSALNRTRAFELLSKDYPVVAAKNEQFAKRQIAAAERNQQEILARMKKMKGVQIGMSKEDVLASSWGKPQKVNTTTNVYGTREQWVYDGGYLYLENGVLTSIQN
jgi:hypothetical protein